MNVTASVIRAQSKGYDTLDALQPLTLLVAGLQENISVGLFIYYRDFEGYLFTRHFIVNFYRSDLVYDVKA